METRFTPAQLAEPDIKAADAILRACVHCGFCTATCPTYLATGDERDSPRGRIWLIRDFLEKGDEAQASAQHHLDRCLTCRNCETTCPSGVQYGHLADIARARLEPARPAASRVTRRALTGLLMRPRLFRLALMFAPLAAPIRRLLPAVMRQGLAHAPQSLPRGEIFDRAARFTPSAAKGLRVVLLTGCAQQAIAPGINEATMRLLTRLGVEVIVKRDAGCCGALAHHLGDTKTSLKAARKTLDAFASEIDHGVDAIVVNTSGCGPMIADYPTLFPGDARARRVAARLMDISTFLNRHQLIEGAGLPQEAPKQIALHLPCTLQHGMGERDAPAALLRRIGVEPVIPAQPHLCCGAAGTYALLEPELSATIGARKSQSLARTGAVVTVSSNVGCITQLNAHDAPKTVHLVELLDWATGGPKPASLNYIHKIPAVAEPEAGAEKDNQA